MTLAALFAAAAAILGAATLWHGTKPHAVAYVAALLCIVGALALALGQPRPVWLGRPEALTVVGVQFEEGRAIWVWTRRPGRAPVAYALPWSEQRAARIARLMGSAAQQHRALRWTTGRYGADQRGGAFRSARNDFRLAPIEPLPQKVKP